FIKTVARKGYRFVAAVEAIDSRAPTEAAGADAGAIAVLDFVNVTSDQESAWLSAGIAETVTGDLRALLHFRVIDRWRVMEAARRTDGSLHQIAQDLSARLVVVGSYQGRATSVRITARTIDDVYGEAVADTQIT